MVLVFGHVVVAARRRRVGRGDATAAARGEAEDTAVQASRVQAPPVGLGKVEHRHRVRGREILHSRDKNSLLWMRAHTK